MVVQVEGYPFPLTILNGPSWVQWNSLLDRTDQSHNVVSFFFCINRNFTIGSHSVIYHTGWHLRWAITLLHAYCVSLCTIDCFILVFKCWRSNSCQDKRDHYLLPFGTCSHRYCCQQRSLNMPGLFFIPQFLLFLRYWG